MSALLGRTSIEAAPPKREINHASTATTVPSKHSYGNNCIGNQTGMSHSVGDVMSQQRGYNVNAKRIRGI
jgi:hypothetical protein